MSGIPELKGAKVNLEFADISKSEYKSVMASELVFDNVDLSGTTINNANMSGVKITDANLSDLEICGAQLGGAYIHNIGLPTEGHPNHEPGVKQRPIKFKHCNLNDSIFTDCNLTNVEINASDIKGMKINGILVEELLASYVKNKG
ncbi:MULTISPECIES: pentapeptide repeat-containing protein [Bacillaceae]|uniref:Pentapeptide repeat-containing protein n=1 Tax=Evansella alkalicola TaxID=745819 RepID=A0ABS6JXH0_9BACI|nr:MULTISPECIES: pentapeptide repeat-containing protein [Bacillaceae]MBU9723290.1 pentapeptide repeat-containing protein [Bacillus alkalicola]